MPRGGILTAKEKAFVSHYLGDARKNATEAARLAGYRGTRATLSVVGNENLRKPKIQEEIAQALQILRDRGISDVLNRIERLDKRWNAIDQVFEARSQDPAIREYPGGDSGILTLEPRRAWLVDDSGDPVPESGGDAGVKTGSPAGGAHSGEAKATAGATVQNRTPIVVWAAVVDVATLKEEREIARQAAIERGEWKEKGELNIAGGGTSVTVTEVTVFRPKAVDDVADDPDLDEDEEDLEE